MSCKPVRSTYLLSSFIHAIISVFMIVAAALTVEMSDLFEWLKWQ